MANAFESQASAILALLRSGELDSVSGSDITIRTVTCQGGLQLGTGLDENGRRIVFSISLATGRGMARAI